MSQINRLASTTQYLKTDENDFDVLPDEIQTMAALELREHPHTKENALNLFRLWIRKNHDIDNVNTDANFLLRFLRAKKFSLPMAQQMLLKYLNLRRTFPNYFSNLDFLSPTVNQLIDAGYMLPSPIRDSMKRRVIITIARNFDSFKYNKTDLAKIHILTYEALICDEITQVTGFVHVGDLHCISPSMLSLFTPTEFARLIKWGEQSLPIRHKSIHLVNVPSIVKLVYDFFQTRISEKIRNRIMVHSSVEKLRENMDVNTLPKEYGGKILLADMIEMWKRELMDKRDKLVSLDKMSLLNSDCLMKKNANNLKLNETYVTGSFRKLELD